MKDVAFVKLSYGICCRGPKVVGSPLSVQFHGMPKPGYLHGVGLVCDEHSIVQSESPHGDLDIRHSQARSILGLVRIIGK